MPTERAPGAQSAEPREKIHPPSPKATGLPVGLHETLAYLTDAQRSAVTHGEGPLLVLAGAGTGKTRVLVERMSWLIQERHVPAHRILTLTFTEKAARELEERVDLALPISAFRPWIGTFHGFAEYVLREQAFQIGLNPGFRIVSAPEGWLLMKKHLFSLPLNRFRPLGNPTRFIQALMDVFSQAKDQGVTPEMVEAYARTPNAESDQWRELAAVYRATVDLQRREGMMDFGDLMGETLRVFRERPDVLATYREMFPYVLVDEFQDTNATQFQLLELLAGPQGNLLAASDDDQAIFAFRGSNVANVLAFHERFPAAGLIVLTENFRSPQIILDRAYELIQHNNPYRLEATRGIVKKLLARGRSSEDGRRNAIEHRHFSTEEAEFAWIAEEIVRLVDGGACYRDIAVLARTNALAAEFVTSLTRRDIPYLVTEARGLLARPEVKDVLAYFRLLVDPDDVRSFFRLMTHPASGIPATDRATLLSHLRQARVPVLSLLARDHVLHQLSDGARVGVRRLAESMTHHSSTFRTLRPSQVYLEFLERSGILKHAILESERQPGVLPNLQAFHAYVRSLEKGSEAGDLFGFLDILEATAETKEGPRAAELPWETDAVRVLTVHGAKGLEFPYVFAIGVTADRYPARNRAGMLELPPPLVPLGAGLDELGDREAHVLEERRLFYVALTRAKARLVLTSSTAAAGTRQHRRPSPFIAEAGLETVIVKPATAHAADQLSLPFEKPSSPAPTAARQPAVTLSASKVLDYLTCPKKYHFRHVLNVPVPPHAALSFGNTIHSVLHHLAVARLSGQEPTIPDALRWFDAQWISDGYDSTAHEQARRDAGRAALRTYLESHPEVLNAAPLAVEVPFSLALPTVRVTGRIDRVDATDPADPRAVVVTDFKTGEGKFRDVGDDVQLSLYSLAVRRALGLEPARLRFSYVETGRDEETTRTPEQDADVVRQVEELASKIRSGAFQATPGFHCRFCDFRNICDEAWTG